MGGLIMPPMMGVGAFLMSEFLGVPYWDVVMRGFALAFVYYVSIALAVYLLCVRLLPRDQVERAAGAALRPGQDRHLLLVRAVPALPDGLWSARANCWRRSIPRPSCSCCCSRPSSIFKYVLKDPAVGGRDAARQHAARDRDPRRHDVLPDAAARHARHHDRPVHRHRLHQPDGRRCCSISAPGTSSP